MLFHVEFEFIDTSEEGEKRSLQVFSKWQPPEGAQFQGFDGFARLRRGRHRRSRQRRIRGEDGRAVDAVASFHDHAHSPDRGGIGDRR